ncbi:MAG: transposase [Eubacterium sp.]|nr:transposase [Eubacterium sp.]
MPRKHRRTSSTGIYHIILRSINHRIIFEENSDYLKFLSTLSISKEKYGIDILAYCVMDTHVHFMLRSDLNNISLFFQSLGSKFVQWYNKKYERSGSLFQERYSSFVVESEHYFLYTLIYIHNNPVKAGVCLVPSEYRWSSFNAYYGAHNPLVNVTYAINLFGSKEALHRFFAHNFNLIDEKSFSFIEKKSNYMTDEDALRIYKEVTGLPSVSATAALPRVTRNNYIRILKKKGLTIKQISRVMAVSTTTVKRICSSAATET